MFLRRIAHFSQADLYPIAFYDQSGGLIGFASFSLGKTRGSLYMMSDFACAQFPRASKLILGTIGTKEFFRFLSILNKQEIFEIDTTAFSANPVSMKYRGVFQLTKRDKVEEGYKLNYVMVREKCIPKEEAVKKWQMSKPK
jgi:hypothetical protein